MLTKGIISVKFEWCFGQGKLEAFTLIALSDLNGYIGDRKGGGFTSAFEAIEENEICKKMTNFF